MVVATDLLEHWKTLKPIIDDRLTIMFFACALNYFILRRDLIISTPYPGAAIGRFLRNLEAKLNRDRRSPSALAFRGMIITLLVCAPLYWLGIFLHNFSTSMEYGWLLETAILAAIICWRLAFDTVDDLVWKNTDMSLYENRNTLSPLSDFDHEVMDIQGVFREGVEATAMNFSEKFIAGIIFYLLFGLPGLMLYYGLWKMIEIVGHPHERWQNFNVFPMLIFKICNFVPSLLASLLFITAAIFTGGGHPLKGAISLKSLNAISTRLLPVHIAASAAGIQLGGHKRRKDFIISYPWVGGGTPKPTETHVRIFIRLLQVATLIFLALLGLAYIKLG